MERTSGRRPPLCSPLGKRGAEIRSPLTTGRHRGVLLLLAALSLTGCGYHLKGTYIRLPEGVRTVTIGEIDNKSREFGLEKNLAFAFEREVYARGVLQLVEAPGVADAVLTGSIRRFSAIPVAFDAQDEAIQYEADLVVALKLRRESDGAILWEANELQAFDEFSVRASTVITSSSQFQRGTVDQADLNAMTNIQLAESEKRLAIDRLIASVVRDAHDRMLEDF